MRLFEATHVFKHDWETVSLANWRKYPNEQTPHVRHVEILNQDVDPVTGVLRTERLIMVRQNVPMLVRKIFGGDTSYVLEYSEVDPRKQTLVMQSQNMTYSNLLSVGEYITYTPDPENSKHTLFTQSAQLKASGALCRFANKIEDICWNRFQDNAHIGKLGLEQVVSKILAERQAMTMPLAQTASD
ncbi:Phospholipid metabolism protein [Coemansia aciculifera]|uniref:Phospholipid metabolism protein n=2 Tax=Coemansia TaxID=4863 RepID=A0A9W8H2I2_9FUNG|nr:Phospholipid metabolism protein [Coemansia sp. S146]KAJ2754539.1 Phospholipid metabolism protein [Coemansia pectinata]KAJ2867562.1 Phospholipid metabolism protein [Coemansia aciculifera]KAJ2876610.1 Phospholipid metabolism protein [Coemansia aciculifera]KAJ2882910.1 Phospholipid metabolism protein [Coemansia aciculifera]